MTNRLLRLTRAELIKLTSHPFFYVSTSLIVLATVVGALMLREERETVWRSYNAIAVFAGGAKVGLKLATFVVLIFGSMLFSGEFDKGTIKILLTRPITRTDLFLSKSIVALGLALFMTGLVLAVALATGCTVGELGPVWDDESYNSNTPYERLLGHAGRAVGMSVGGVVAAAFLGMLVSNLVESSGFSVAMALTVFLLADEIVLRVFRNEELRKWFSNQYPGYAFDVLRDFARGSSTQWKEIFISGAPYLTAPLASIAVFTAVGYVIFRLRNITA